MNMAKAFKRVCIWQHYLVSPQEKETIFCCLTYKYLLWKDNIQYFQHETIIASTVVCLCTYGIKFSVEVCGFV